MKTPSGRRRSGEGHEALKRLMDAHPSRIVAGELANVGISESPAELRRLWLAGEEREHRLRIALSRIAERSQRILNGEITTTAHGAAEYNLQVSRLALAPDTRPTPEPLRAAGVGRAVKETDPR